MEKNGKKKKRGKAPQKKPVFPPQNMLWLFAPSNCAHTVLLNGVPFIGVMPPIYFWITIQPRFYF